MLGVPNYWDFELQPDVVLKLAEEGKVDTVNVRSDEGNRVDLGKTIDALRKSPGGIKGLEFHEPIAESDFLEILKIVAHHEYVLLKTPPKLSNSGLIKALNLMPQGLF